MSLRGSSHVSWSFYDTPRLALSQADQSTGAGEPHDGFYSFPVPLFPFILLNFSFHTSIPSQSASSSHPRVPSLLSTSFLRRECSTREVLKDQSEEAEARKAATRAGSRASRAT
jgi:hypothetical protein